MKTITQHLAGGFKSGAIVGVMTGGVEGIFLLSMGYLSSYMHSEEFRYMGNVDLSTIWVSVMADGYSGIVGGLILGFFLGLLYSTRGYRPARTNLDIMYFAFLFTIFFFGVIEVKMALDWLPSGITMTSGILWLSTLVLLFVTYTLYCIIRWIMHSVFEARLSFMLFYRRAFFFNSAILVVVNIIWLITSSLSIGGSRYGGGKAGPILPNIMLIVMDTVRADHLSCYGYYRNTSPNLDAMAREGVIFTNAISPSPWTLPSHASMFTGLYPSQHGLNHRNFKLSPQATTLADVLRNIGYQTVGFSCNPWVGKASGLDQGFEEFYEIWLPKDMPSIIRLGEKLLRLVNTGEMDKGAAQANLKIKKWLGRWDRSKPFFIFVNYIEPHLGYYPPPPYNELFLEVSREKAEGVNQDPIAYMARKVEMTEEDFDILKSLYDGEIAYLDSRMGEIFSLMREMRILDETLLIITSDHGENIGDHNLMDHQLCLYDSLIKVPLVIRYPKLISRGRTVSSPVQTVDILPTIFSILQDHETGNHLKGLPGKNILNTNNNVTRAVVAEYSRPLLTLRAFRSRFPEFNRMPHDREIKAFVKDGVKYIWSSDGRDELYDLNQDPRESENIINKEPLKLSELRVSLARWVSSVSSRSTKARSATFDRATSEKLRSLGYIE